MPAPLKFKEPMERRNLFIPVPLWEITCAIAQAEDRPAAEVVRQAMADYARRYARNAKAARKKRANALLQDGGA